jgi:hypothetical protein
LTEIRIYFEGKDTLRSGFEHFFEELRRVARSARSKIQFIAAKDGPSAYRKAWRSHPAAWNILLKDSEGPMPLDSSAVCRSLGIEEVHARDVFWMVELMESWFLADPETIAKYFRHPNFAAKALGNAENVEHIPKADVLRRLKDATKNTSKGEYSKVRHAPEILKRLDSALVRQRAENCEKLFREVIARV